MANDQIVGVVIQATDKTEDATRSAAQNVREGAAEIEGAASGAREGIEHLEASLKSFTRSARAEGRMIGFFTRDLVEMTGAGREAKEVLNGLVGGAFAAATGNPVLAAMEAIRAGVGLMKSVGEEAKRALEEADKVIDPILKEWEERTRALAVEIVKLRGGEAAASQFTYNQQRDAALEEITKLRIKRAPEEKINEELNKLARLEQAHASAMLAMQTKADIERRKHEEDEFNRVLAQQNKQYLEKEKHLAEHLKRESALVSEYMRKRPPDYGGAQGNVYELMRRAGGRNSGDPSEGVQQDAQAGVYNLMNRQGGEGNKYDPEHLKEVNKQIKEQQAQVDATARAWMRYGEKVGDALLQVMEGHKKMGDVIRMVMRDALKEVIAYALKSIMAHAFDTGAKVENQWADKGPYGWLIGLGQAAAAIASSMAFGNSISAEGGADLGSFTGSQPAYLHTKEMVLPQDLAEGARKTFRAAAAGQGGGGGGMTINLTAIDAKGTMDWLERHPREFQIAMQRNARRGGTG